MPDSVSFQIFAHSSHRNVLDGIHVVVSCWSLAARLTGLYCYCYQPLMMNDDDDDR